MDVETQIRSWKDPKFRASLGVADGVQNPAGDRLVELNEDELRGVWGAQEQGPVVTFPSEGHVCSVSGECNGSGQSCWR